MVVLPILSGEAHTQGPVTFPNMEGDIYAGWGGGFRGTFRYDRTVLPFAIGDLDPSKPFVHVLDDVGLDVVLRELDTATDFVQFLSDRERLLRSDRLLMASGDDDLLAVYLRDEGGYAARTFDGVGRPEGKVIIPEGEWDRIRRSPGWTARKRADAVSYRWDKIIERFNSSILDGSSPVYPEVDVWRQELAVRAMAREPRLHRRILAAALADWLHFDTGEPLRARTVGPVRHGSPYYIFITLRRELSEERTSYRKRRQAVCWTYLIEAKRTFAEMAEVVILGTDPAGESEWYSEDLLYHGVEPADPRDVEAIRDFVEEQGVLSKTDLRFKGHVLEYPSAHPDHGEPRDGPAG